MYMTWWWGVMVYVFNKSGAGIAWCPATVLTSSEVMLSGHALYLYQVLRNYLECCTKFCEIIWNDIKVIEWTWFLYWKLQRGIILQKDTISILTIYKITKGHKTEKNAEGVTVHNQILVILLFVPSFVKLSQTVSKL